MVGEKIVDFILEKHGKTGLNIAFLPYCYKMWDCMASVYESAKEKGIGVGVFPIPYFSLVDGHIDEWHYELEDFEGAVEEDDLYDFNKFFEVCNEIDYVVIHNAYDDGNNLTTVNPLFYTEVLKANGLKIIFIPYGIPYGGTSSDAMRLTKGAFNSDYIFVNNDAEREGMIETFKKVGYDISGKVFAFGSPKLDGLQKSYDMPVEWRKKVYKPITLICTSILPFMKDPERKFKQYKDTLWAELAKGNMVIFRPHPLMEETIKSRCPYLLDEWLRFIDIVEEKAIVDYDHELTESIYFSQSMITDVSSVVEIWKETGKPYEVLE